MKKLVSLVMALALTLCMAVPAFATPVVPGEVPGQTTVGIQVYDYDPDNLAKSVSFTVPLYITMAVTKVADGSANKSKIITPTSPTYGITNNAPTGGSAIAVTKLNVEKILNSDWTLATGVVTGANKFSMSLGATGTTLVDLTAGEMAATTGFITASTDTAVVKS
ncbi:MAG: hypothetical protein RSC76_09370, partial [Oscillospiraceae bacterium]